jgi:hypothetical protein
MTDDVREASRWTEVVDDPLREVSYLAIGCVGLIGVTAASAMVGGDGVSALVAELTVLVIAAWGAGAVETTLLVAAAWGLLTGFVVNRYGELTFAPSDIANLGFLTAAGWLAFATGHVYRRLTAPAPRPDRPSMARRFG